MIDAGENNSVSVIITHKLDWMKPQMEQVKSERERVKEHREAGEGIQGSG